MKLSAARNNRGQAENEENKITSVIDSGPDPLISDFLLLRGRLAVTPECLSVAIFPILPDPVPD